MRTLLFLVFALQLAACASEPSPGADASMAEPVDPDPSAPAALTANALEGDWFYCSGPSVLDTQVAFEAGQVSTYIDGRPGLFGDYVIEGADLVVGDFRYPAAVAGSVLTLSTEDGPGVYARTVPACPAGAGSVTESVTETADVPDSEAAPPAGPHETRPRPEHYDGDLDLLGDVRLCHTHDRTTTAQDRGMEVCYVVTLEQHRDGSLYGKGAKVSEWRAEEGSDRLVPTDLAPSERDSVRVVGHIDNDDVVHLQYTVGGRQQGVAWYGKPVYMDWGGGMTDLLAIEGAFRTEGGDASGPARLDFEVE